MKPPLSPVSPPQRPSDLKNYQAMEQNWHNNTYAPHKKTIPEWMLRERQSGICGRKTIPTSTGEWISPENQVLLNVKNPHYAADVGLRWPSLLPCAPVGPREKDGRQPSGCINPASGESPLPEWPQRHGGHGDVCRNITTRGSDTTGQKQTHSSSQNRSLTGGKGGKRSDWPVFQPRA